MYTAAKTASILWKKVAKDVQVYKQRWRVNRRSFKDAKTPVHGAT
jgi:hypothetical protein